MDILFENSDEKRDNNKAAALESFSAKMRERDAVYRQTWVHVLEGLAMMKANVQSHKAMMQTATALQNFDRSLQLASSISDSGYVTRIGNEQLGYWASSLGVEGAQMFQQGLQVRAIDPASQAHLEMLEKRWREYE